MVRPSPERADALEHLDAYRREILARAAQSLRRAGAERDTARQLLATSGLDRRLSAAGPDELEAERSRARKAREAVAERCASAGRSLPLQRVREGLALSEPAALLLAAGALSQLDPAIARLWQALRPSPAAPAFPLGVWIELLGAGSPARFELLDAVDPRAPLRRLALFEVDDQRAPLLSHAEARVPPRVAAALAGLEAHERELSAAAAILRAPLSAGDVVLGEADQKALDHLASREAGAPRRILLLGEQDAGRETRARLLAARQSGAILAIDPLAAGAPGRTLALALREAVLCDALPVVRLDRFADGGPELSADLQALLVDQLAPFERPLCLVAPESLAGSLHAALSGMAELRVPRPSSAVQSALWRRELSRGGRTPEPGLAEQLISAFDMSPGDIVGVSRRLIRHADAPASISMKDVRDAIRSGVTEGLYGLARPYRTPLTWDDVVLPPETMELLHELLAHARHRTRVFDDWGFSRKVAYGRSLSSLFYGPPGTGKTMVAGILAEEIGRDLYRVDLSRVIDKYVGETEKNLRRIFREAGRAQAMLLFDEADSLFSKRTGVDSANDRYANLAVNYLLQEMEEFEGVCILTTNMDSVLDEAFRRRLRFRIEFPKPTEKERKALWRSMFPPEASVAGEIDWAELARSYPEMTGGHIRNAALRAAFLAASEDANIEPSHLRRAARAEYEEMGHIATR